LRSYHELADVPPELGIALRLRSQPRSQSTGRAALLRQSLFDECPELPVVCSSFRRHLRLRRDKIFPCVHLLVLSRNLAEAAVRGFPRFIGVDFAHVVIEVNPISFTWPPHGCQSREGEEWGTSLSVGVGVGVISVPQWTPVREAGRPRESSRRKPPNAPAAAASIRIQHPIALRPIRADKACTPPAIPNDRRREAP
jgi:hypothetical protein